jgi:RNA polymerase sigma factor (sigma-70 family)
MTRNLLQFRRRPATAADGRSASAEADRFRRIMLVHMDAAYGYARYLTRDAAAAEDVVQEAFLRAFRSFATWRGEGARAWLLAIVRRAFLDRAASLPPQPVSCDAAPEPRDDDTPEAILMRRSEAETVRATIEALPEPFREAIVLRELQDMSYREISDITGAPMGTVMSRLARARQMLAVSLAGVRS